MQIIGNVEWQREVLLSTPYRQRHSDLVNDAADKAMYRCCQRLRKFGSSNFLVKPLGKGLPHLIQQALDRKRGLADQFLLALASSLGRPFFVINRHQEKRDILI